MVITPKTWQEQFGSALKKGQDGLDEAVGLYLWARDHLKELHKVDPDYTQDRTASEISRVWNISVDTYCRTVVRLGGGTDPESVEKGRAVIRRFSPFETFRAEQQLGIEQMRKLVDKLPSLAGPDDLKKAVDELRAELDALAVDAREKDKSSRVDYRKRCAQLEREVSSCREKIKVLETELRWFRKNVKLTTTQEVK
jgi:hypothetical protein